MKRIQLFFTLFACLASLSCVQKPTCHDISGQWSNTEGQKFIFLPSGEALWLLRFGSLTDSFPIRYRYNCSKNPVELDLFGFSKGPLLGKTLFGIIAWSSDTSFRFDCEAGMDASERPKDFDIKQSQLYFRGADR